ncbi:MAG: hypothetical protein IKE89_03840 [Bacilli bacterium]|nr:hypothetical protein [Bacilli bacterium]
MILDTKGNKFNNERNNFNTKMDSIKNNAQIVDEANLNPFVEDVNSTSYADPTNTKAMNEKRLAMLHDRLEQGQISFNEFNEKARKINNNNDN